MLLTGIENPIITTTTTTTTTSSEAMWQRTVKYLHAVLRRKEPAVPVSVKEPRNKVPRNTLNAELKLFINSLGVDTSAFTGSPDSNVSMLDVHVGKLLWMCSRGHAGVREVTEQVLDWRAKQTSRLAYVSEDLKC